MVKNESPTHALANDVLTAALRKWQAWHRFRSLTIIGAFGFSVSAWYLFLRRRYTERL